MASTSPAADRAACPDCGAAVGIDDDAAVGEVVECPECGAPLELVALTPPTLTPFEEEEK